MSAVLRTLPQFWEKNECRERRILINLLPISIIYPFTIKECHSQNLNKFLLSNFPWQKLKIKQYHRYLSTAFTWVITLIRKRSKETLTIKRTGTTHSKVQFFGFVTFSPVYIRCRFKTNGFSNTFTYRPQYWSWKRSTTHACTFWQVFPFIIKFPF